jgi:hypothetical protein
LNLRAARRIVITVPAGFVTGTGVDDQLNLAVLDGVGGMGLPLETLLIRSGRYAVGQKWDQVPSVAMNQIPYRQTVGPPAAWPPCRHRPH